MGVSHSPAELQRKLATFQVNLANRNVRQITEAAKTIKAATLLSAAAATGGDGRLNNAGKSGARLGVGYTITKSGDDARARVKARGPWQLVEHPLKPHVITSRYAGGSRRSRAAAVAAGRKLKGGRRAIVQTPFGPRRFVHHPGVRTPKRPWALGVKAAEPRVTNIMRGWVAEELRKVF